ncbi:MAG TPA: hypothetical protein VFX97_11945 [Pyrinomonadaceae bacterium]|nr:hypothetical protein [Pyrinomonadaceae bacterium]
MIYEPDNDADYHDWLDTNPSGFVINSDKRRTNPNYPIIHGSLCFHINDKNLPNYTTAEYMKKCSLDRSALEGWAKTDGRGMKLCQDCKRRGLV